ncbi:MAG: hypothetical protein FWG85_00275 [Bacteroidetes bacterium]|nr:hypothetical protein [Bacteroidota bacterium]
MVRPEYIPQNITDENLIWYNNYLTKVAKHLLKQDGKALTEENIENYRSRINLIRKKNINSNVNKKNNTF